ncbi:MAG: DUF424 family protein [Nitrososphaerales archaeon]
MREKGFVAKIINYKGMKMVNLCDEELVGRVIKGNGLEINLSRDYYGDMVINSEEALKLVKKSSIINLAGNRIVDLVLKEKLAHELAPKKVGKVSFLMIYKFKSS